jgi:hypothetical protein
MITSLHWMGLSNPCGMYPRLTDIYIKQIFMDNKFGWMNGCTILAQFIIHKP